MYRLGFFLFLITSGIPSGSNAQALRFGSGIFAGLNLSQIDGDDMQGYDKMGINAGLRGIAYIIPKLEFHTELAYNQRGSQSKGFSQSNDKGRKMILDYASINALVVLNDWFHPIKEYYRIQACAGVGTGRLIRSNVYDPAGDRDQRQIPLSHLPPFLNTTDFSLILGINVKVDEQAGLSFRFNRSMNKLLDSDLVPTINERRVYSMTGYFISCDFFYHF
ncbi:MAG TPA: hypothetical protein PKM27_12265 [Saprospiraceae bacterium]|nr:hypothetical protein [Saprospiraceae bacterium]HNT21731.1 hypothetical protein [Saprospiraceae bacterium]